MNAYPPPAACMDKSPKTGDICTRLKDHEGHHCNHRTSEWWRRTK